MFTGSSSTADWGKYRNLKSPHRYSKEEKKKQLIPEKANEREAL